MFSHSSAPHRVTRVVILGATGFVGRHLVAEFTGKEIEVLGLSSKDLDLAAPDASKRLTDFLSPSDTLIFASCITRDRGDDLSVFRKNIVMAEQVGLCIEKSPCAHFIYLSSDAVYAERNLPIREDSECKPAGLYPMVQFARETMVTHSAAKAKMPLVILRLCAVYGKGDTHNGYGPNRFVKTAIESGKISLFGEGEETRDHIFVKDVCRVVCACAELKTTGILNVVSGQAVSFMAVAQAVSRAAGRPVSIEISVRKSPISHKPFDNSLLIKAFPMLSYTSIDAGIMEVFKS